MNLLSWNCRGLGTLRAVREVANMVREFNPQVIFLMETKKKRQEMEWLRSRWRFDKVFTVDGVGRGGGLALLWLDEARVEITSYSRYHIEAIVGSGNEDSTWRLTGFYGDPETYRRTASWEMLRRLKSMTNLPWLCVGDFNEVLSNDEKLGGALRP